MKYMLYIKYCINKSIKTPVPRWAVNLKKKLLKLLSLEGGEGVLLKLLSQEGEEGVISKLL